MRALVVIGIALLAFLGGAWAGPLVTMAADQQPEGRALKCLARGTVCVGMSAESVLSSSSEDNFGGLIGVYCGFDRPGAGVGPDENFADVIGHGCSGGRYVAQFSDGRRMTSIWIDNGRVVRLDRAPRHTLDL
jgi:hypothetical protein